METPMNRQPHPPCALPHHQVGRRVGMHQWHNEARAMEYLFGTVIEHHGRRITIEVEQLDEPLIIETECGHIFPAVKS